MPPTTVKTLTGQRFGKLVVIERAPRPDSKRAYWVCQCDCGRTAVKMGKYLLCGDTSSCGCEQRAMRARGNNHRYADLPKTHRREYTIWRSMKSRCYVTSSSNFKFYGAKGITVCERWRTDFALFLEDMGPCPPEFTLDRIDPAKPYEPANCRWASWLTQHNNTSRNRMVTVGTRTMSLAQYVREAAPDLVYNTIWKRMRAESLAAPEAVRAIRTHRATPQ
jgi:hypothetical protein